MNLSTHSKMHSVHFATSLKRAIAFKVWITAIKRPASAALPNEVVSARLRDLPTGHDGMNSVPFKKYHEASNPELVRQTT
jgi:hypothetical protein